MNEWLWGLFVSLFVVGGILGSAFAGRLASHLGRRGTLLWNNIGFILGCLLIIEAKDVVSLCFGRFFIGMSAGIGTAVVPLYINELTQLHHRGSIGSLNQLSIVIGSFIAGVLGIPLSNKESWRWLFGIGLGTFSIPMSCKTRILITMDSPMSHSNCIVDILLRVTFLACLQ
jgi:MFS family permease